MTYFPVKRLFCFFLTVFLFHSIFGQKNDPTLEARVDSIVKYAIQQKAFPGCVVYVRHKDKPIFLKSYGHMTYDSARKTKPNTIYDLASLTKVTATLLCLMKMHEEGMFDLDDPIGNYIGGLNSSISKLTFRQLLTHQSGLPPGVRFFDKIKKDGEYIDKTLSYVRTLDYNWRVGRSLYAFHDLYPVIKDLINEVEVTKEPQYVYSDLFFYLVPEMVYNLTKRRFEEVVTNEFFIPMGAETLVFNAGRKFEDYEIAPTEIDTVFRMETVHGTVHDEGASLLRGVSGHAGLFGNAEDLAKVWQMYLNDGVLDGKRYLKAHTLNLFTSVQYPSDNNHRALGFDKVLFEYNPELSYQAPEVSIRSFGHTGFTGTMVWADPDEDLLFVFLSNRVHPSRTHTNLKDLRIRPILHQLFYKHVKGL